MLNSAASARAEAALNMTVKMVALSANLAGVSCSIRESRRAASGSVAAVARSVFIWSMMTGAARRRRDQVLHERRAARRFERERDGDRRKREEQHQRWLIAIEAGHPDKALPGEVHGNEDNTETHTECAGGLRVHLHLQAQRPNYRRFGRPGKCQMIIGSMPDPPITGACAPPGFGCAPDNPVPARATSLVKTSRDTYLRDWPEGRTIAAPGPERAAGRKVRAPRTDGAG